MLRHFYLYIALFLLLPSTLRAGDYSISRRISSADGLTNDFVTEIAVDGYGYVWTAGEAGVDSGAEQVDENGNPIEQPVDENGNPVQQEVDENGNPIQQEEPQQPETPEEKRAIEQQYESVIKSVDPSISKQTLLETAMVQGVSPEEFKRAVQKQALKTKKELMKKKQLAKIINSVPDEVSQDMVSKISAENQVPLEELSEQMNARQEMIMQEEEQSQQAQQAQQEQQSEPEQRKDFNYPKYRKIKHVNNWDDEDFRFEKFKKSNGRSKRNIWD